MCLYDLNTSLGSRHGAVEVEEEEREIARQRSAAFQGTGFKLGDSEGPSVMVGNKALPKPEKVYIQTIYVMEVYVAMFLLTL